MKEMVVLEDIIAHFVVPWWSSIYQWLSESIYVKCDVFDSN